MAEDRIGPDFSIYGVFLCIGGINEERILDKGSEKRIPRIYRG